MWTIHTVLWYHNVDHTYSTEKQDCCIGLWLAETFSTSPLKPLNWIQQNLTGSKISMSSTKFVFLGPIGKTRWPPWPIPQKGGILYSGARYVALWASCSSDWNATATNRMHPRILNWNIVIVCCSDWFHNFDSHAFWFAMISQCGPYIQHSDITMWTKQTVLWYHNVDHTYSTMISQCGPYIQLLLYHNVDHTYRTLTSQCGPYIQSSDITMWTIRIVLWYHNVDHTFTVLWYHSIDHTYRTLISQYGPYIQYSDITMWTIHTVLWFHNVDHTYKTLI